MYLDNLYRKGKADLGVAAKASNPSAAADLGSEGRRGGTSLGSFELRQDVFHDPSLGTQVPPSSESNTLPIGMNA